MLAEIALVHNVELNVDHQARVRAEQVGADDEAGGIGCGGIGGAVGGSNALWPLELPLLDPVHVLLRRVMRRSVSRGQKEQRISKAASD